ncbi:GLPGLI family protein [Chryseobacterium arachidis]|uniref:GLPGLI family protein n=1 Tax=Chryseobacterium arachidis TaxID=1416778 RepID=A0A1M5HA58_9FLAO|nr:GLPGLI family protein [Chryseobacterium arachidis]SHG12796.1 GLPGLI family protein [Chryseobacterium arachidis]
MKLKLIIILFTLTAFLKVFSQSYKIVYDFKWKTEENTENYNSELTVLLKNKENSYFESLAKFKYDSVKTKLVKQGSRNFPAPKQQWKLQTLIFKDLKSQTTITEENFFDKVYLTTYRCKPSWKILQEKSRMFNYNVQKAEADFGGRKWIAWFTNEIPISDGPYKFYGLPGLILKISDFKENFIFEIKGLTKEENNIDERNAYTAKVNFTPKQWETFWTQYQKDPAMIFANLNSSNATATYVYYGQNIDSKEVKEAYNKSEKQKIDVFKNPIELKTCE